MLKQYFAFLLHNLVFSKVILLRNCFLANPIEVPARNIRGNNQDMAVGEGDNLRPETVRPADFHFLPGMRLKVNRKLSDCARVEAVGASFGFMVMFMAVSFPQ